MTILTREAAIHASAETKTNKVGTCQWQVRTWYNAPSVGDVDGDGAADAEDGWKSEPAWAKHFGDRNPPPGVPLSFLGGRNDNGHRAMSWPNGRVRSTDFDTATQRYRAGVVGTANSIEAVERAMGVSYAGWSETIDRNRIPLAHPPKDPPHKPEDPPVQHGTRGPRVEGAINDLGKAERDAREGTPRDNKLDRVIKLLKSIPFLKKRKH